MSKSKPFQCQHCSEPANLHISKVIDGKVTKVSMCSNCPEGEAAKSETSFDLVGGPTPKMAAVTKTSYRESSVACPTCGLTPGDFKAKGRLGCSHCYEAFADKLSPILKKLHSGESHSGKSPGKEIISVEDLDLAELPDPRSLSEKDVSGPISDPQDEPAGIDVIEALKEKLQASVEREEYELAAQLRDQIKSLDNERS